MSANSEPTKAVFLSYASQDSEVVRTICETLRTAGIGVWFDQEGGLEHGDEWDAKIRRQIKECVFFLPIISAHTQSRHEGYFRIEWELAAERAMGFAHNVPFVLPIVIDDTREPDALVPERFRKVQWTRLPGGAVVPEMRARLLKLWTERTGASRPPHAAQTVHEIRSPTLGFSPVAMDEKSIAVLPFANMSADAENEYFSDGMTEEIINALVQVPELRVAARTSVFAFKGRADDLRTIAGKLNVRTVLEGSVRKSGKRIRITAQLINADDGYHIWSERFDRDLDDIFAVQDEIARTIADKLKAKLAGGGQQPLVVASTDDVDAYQLYLQGRYYFAQRGAGLTKGLHLFEAALARDPNFAPAYAGLADAYSLLALYGNVRGKDAMPKVRAALERALAIDPKMAEAHCALGFLLFFSDRDTRAARQEFRQAIALKPSYAASYYWGAATFSAIGRQEDAVAMTQQGMQIEPFSLIANSIFGWTLTFARRSEEAVARLQQMVELDPRFLVAYWVLGQALIASGRPDEGIAALRKSVALSNNLAWMVATLGCGLACVGKTEEARDLLNALTRRAASEYVPAYPLAMLYAYLGQEATAVTWLECAMADGDPGLSFLRCDVGPITPMVIPTPYLSAANRAAFVERLGLNRE